MVSQDEFQMYLKGLNFPATKNEVMGIAKNNNASGEALKMVKKLPKDRYLDMDDLRNDIMGGE